MIHFPDTVLHRYILSEDAKGVYGETVNKHVSFDDILVDFQNENNVEVCKNYGCELEDTYKIYLDINTPLGESDILEDDKGNFYQIVGGIKEYKKFHKYKKANIVLQRRGKH